jgi:uncharacterized SAM-binding protein YcdF (DUF218 family)
VSSLARAIVALPLLVALFLLQDVIRLPLQAALQIWAYPDSASYSCPVDALLVMGAAQYNGQPSPAFRRRLDLAAELYGRGCAERIVVSGGRRAGDRFSEGEAGVAYLAGKGVPESDLLAETEATTSYQNVRNSLPLLAGSRVVIVTDDMHAFRSRWLARELGLAAEVAAVPVARGRLAYGGRELAGLLAHQTGYLR